MTSGQSHRIVEEEQGGPGSGSIERLLEVLELDMTDDPKGTVVMTFQSSVVINKTATIPGEQTTCRNSMKISPHGSTLFRRPIRLLCAAEQTLTSDPPIPVPD